MSTAATLAAVGSDSQVLWYVARGSGLVDLVLLSLTVVLGIGQLHRWAGRPRFVVAGLHRNVALLTMIFLAVHVVTIELDTYVHIGLWAVFVPWTTGYHPFTVALGAVSLDLLVAVVATSLLRHRIGYRTWRALHWSTYAAWPLGVAHGLALGTDSGEIWVWVLNAVCIGAVVAMTGWRIIRLGRPGGSEIAPLPPVGGAAPRRLSPTQGPR